MKDITVDRGMNDTLAPAFLALLIGCALIVIVLIVEGEYLGAFGIGSCLVAVIGLIVIE